MNFSSHDLAVPMDKVIACATPAHSNLVRPTPVLLSPVLVLDSSLDEGSPGDAV